MNRKLVYLTLAIVGTLGPALAITPFLLENGLNPHLVLEVMFSTPVAAFAGWNLLVSCGCLVVLAHTEGREKGIKTWMPVIAMAIFGISSGLPLYLYLRESAAAHTAL